MPLLRRPGSLFPTLFASFALVLLFCATEASVCCFKEAFEPIIKPHRCLYVHQSMDTFLGANKGYELPKSRPLSFNELLLLT
jgi:hypothetical protein